jgi:hypothetical protein
MKTINPKAAARETKARALTRALAYMAADLYVDRRRREWQTGPDPEEPAGGPKRGRS